MKNSSSEEKWQDQDLDLFKTLNAIDNKQYDYYSKLSPEQQKKFVPYLYTQWTSCVKAKSQISAYYVLSTETNVNKYLFNEHVTNHPELQWKMMCAASPGIGKQFHAWIPQLSAKISSYKSLATSKEVKEYFQKIYKSTNSDDIGKCADLWVKEQNHEFKLAHIYEEMKLSDIKVLAKLVSSEEISKYERDCGNY
jgi:hypothetical protein